MAFGNATNLPAVRPGTALTPQADPSPALPVVAGNIPKSVKRGVLEIMVAFPAFGMADSDRGLLMDLYLEAVEGFPRAVVEWTLKYLVFNNPRNTPTFTAPPTPQDVRDACGKTALQWARWVEAYYLERGQRWAIPSTDETLTKKGVELSRFAAAHKAKPGDDGCIIPRDLQMTYLQKAIAAQFGNIESKFKKWKNGSQPLRHLEFEDLVAMPDDAFNGIPADGFPDGVKDELLRIRTEVAEAQRVAVERARAEEEERRLRVDREQREIEQEIAAIEAENTLAEDAARRELTGRWDTVFFVRPHSDTAWHWKEWLSRLDQHGHKDVIERALAKASQFAVPSKCPRANETEFPVLVAFRDSTSLRKRLASKFFG